MQYSGKYYWSRAVRRISNLRLGYYKAGIQFCMENSLLAVTSAYGPYDLVVHVGAHTASEAPTYEALGAERVVWVEADPETAARARERLHARGAAQHILVAAAASDGSTSTRSLYRSSNDGASSSVHPPGPGHLTLFPDVHWTGEALRVPTMTLAEILTCTATDIERYARSLLVVDCQGHEYEVVMGAGADVLAQFQVVISEVSIAPLYEGARPAHEVINLLEACGFVPVTPIPEAHGDVLFMRRL